MLFVQMIITSSLCVRGESGSQGSSAIHAAAAAGDNDTGLETSDSGYWLWSGRFLWFLVVAGMRRRGRRETKTREVIKAIVVVFVVITIAIVIHHVVRVKLPFDHVPSLTRHGTFGFIVDVGFLLPAAVGS